MPIELRDVLPTPELMRLRIISVAAENWGTYFGGESVMGWSVLLCAAGVLGGASIVSREATAVVDIVGLRRRFPQNPQRLTNYVWLGGYSSCS